MENKDRKKEKKKKMLAGFKSTTYFIATGKYIFRKIEW